MKIKPVSKPSPYNPKKGLARWIVYYFDPEKHKRWAKYFVTKEEADTFYEETRILEMRLGIEANRISFEDKRDLIETKRLLAPLKISTLSAVQTFIRLSQDLQNYGYTLENAIDEFKKLSKVKERSITLQKAVARYEHSLYAKDITSNYRNKTIKNIERFTSAMGDEKVVSLITSKEIENWILSLKKREYSDSPSITVCGKPMRIFTDSDESICTRTRNEFRVCLYTFFKFCKSQEWLDFNPLERINAWRERSKTPQIFTPEEVRKLLDATPPQSGLRAYIAIAAFAGIRSAELQRLTWDKVKLDDREIVLDSEITKTASRRVVKVTENLAKWLEPFRPNLESKTLVVGDKFKGILDHFQRKFRSLWIANGLRHSAATYYLALTKNSYLTAEQMGHAVDVLKKHYNGLAREKDAIRYFEILPE